MAVLGAGGFLGSHLVPAFAARFAGQIDAIDHDLHKLEFSHPRVHPMRARIEEPGLVDAITARCHTVVSLTALCNPALYNTVPLEVIDGNYTHLVPLVKRCAERNVRLIHFSTSEVYGRMAVDSDGERTETMNEERSALFLGPVDRERWTYACAKQLLERLIWAHGPHGLRFSIVRLFNVIGPRMDYLPGIDGHGVPRVLASFMNALLRGKELSLVGGGHQRRSFMAVADLVEAVCRIVERPDACDRQIMNLGHPENQISIAELARLLAKVFVTQVPQAVAPRFRSVAAEALSGPGYDDSQARIPDIDKARRLLDWQPTQTLEQMLPSIVDDYVLRYADRIASEADDAPSVRATL
ncbi:MAG TPA: NAD-dependent epimerase/dehydratase family protein [Polyangiales bacterium]